VKKVRIATAVILAALAVVSLVATVRG